MTDSSKPFDFSTFVPGFDFLKNLAGGSAKSTASAVPGIPGLGSWVAPTLSVEEVDKRIQELKAVQFWLEQNMTALKATIQALEVQKMTLSTLKGMNVRMEDLANVFTSGIAAAKAQPAAAPKEPVAPAATASATSTDGATTPSAPVAGGAGVVDPLQWWGALTQQFEQIAGSAMRDAANLKVPSVLEAMVGKTTGTISKRASTDASGGARSTKKKASPAAKSAPASKRATSRKR
jgi:hypothetical protein